MKTTWKTANWQEYQKEYYKQTREKQLAYGKKWKEEHKDELKDYNKAYYEENKQALIEKKKFCHICKKEYSSLNFSKHVKTKKHQVNTAKVSISDLPLKIIK
jgi:hypothetical protein